MRQATRTPEAASSKAEDRPDRGSLGVRIGAGLFLALIAAILVVFGLGVVRRGGEGATFAGFGVNAIGQAHKFTPRPLPAANLKLYGGGELQLAELRGQVTVLNFWASWCVPCRKEAPVLARAAASPANRNVRFVGINEWDPETDATRFLRDFGITYANGPDSGGRIAIELGMTGIPETYVANTEGMIVARWVGPLDDGELDALIRQGETSG